MLNQRLQQSGDLAKHFRRVHFVGIGGVGMSGIAEVMVTLGYQVSGSDLSENAATKRLVNMGAKVYRGHHADNVQDTDVIVVSSAIRQDNPELIGARQARIPIVPRAEMLAELMRFKRGIAIAGTHGKTTTTSITASVLSEAGLDPTFVIGGQLLSAGSNARLGSSAWLVAEADESDGSFLRLSPLIAVVTNIDADHLESYLGEFSRLKEAFAEFLHRLPFYGLAILCVDDPEVAELADAMPRHLVRYGLADNADVRATELRFSGAQSFFKLHLPGQDPIQVSLNLPGKHNVQNALAAAAVGWQLGVSAEKIGAAFANFSGVGRRFNMRGNLQIGNANVLFVDDYGHHPAELAAVFSAARAGWPDRRLVVAFQPHRYSRTRDLFDEFAAVLSEVDVLVLTEVYPAGEAPISGADAKSLARAIRARGRIEPIIVNSAAELQAVLPDVAVDGDLLIYLGAGDIGYAANALVEASAGGKA